MTSPVSVARPWKPERTRLSSSGPSQRICWPRSTPCKPADPIPHLALRTLSHQRMDSIRTHRRTRHNETRHDEPSRTKKGHINTMKRTSQHTTLAALLALALAPAPLAIGADSAEQAAIVKEKIQ